MTLLVWYICHESRFLLTVPTSIQHKMYRVYTVWHVCATYFTASFIVHNFGWDVSLVSFSTLLRLDLCLNPVPFAIDVHLSIFACVWAYFGRTSVTQQKRGLCEKRGFAIGSSCCCWDTSEEKENWTHSSNLPLTRPHWMQALRNMRLCLMWLCGDVLEFFLNV